MAAYLTALRDRDMRLFFTGQSTSLLGSAMSGLAVTFAVLSNGGTGTDVGYVMAARIIPVVVCLLGGGVIADRQGPRRVMLAADILRFATQASLAVTLLAGPTPMWVFTATAAVLGAGEGFFFPAIGALIPHVAATGRTYKGKLQDANALNGLGQSVANVCGPALAGVVVAAAGSGVAVALDAGSYAVSVASLAALRLPAHGRHAATATTSLLADLADGWTEFRKRTWMWVTTLQFTLFNFLVWAPFLVLGPVVAEQRLGGAGAWGAIMTAYGSGAVAGGLGLVGRHPPRRPLVVATISTWGWALPPGAIALGLPTPLIAAAAGVGGLAGAVHGAAAATADQEHVPAGVLARVNSIVALGAFALGPAGLAGAGPVASVIGVTTVLGFGAVWQLAATAVVLAVPDVRRLRRLTEPTSQPP